MPTRKQLSRIWETQFEFFGGFGQPRANYIGASEGTTEGHGLTTERLVETPISPKLEFTPFTGKEIGNLQLDSDTGDLKIIINQELGE
jgi:hypothetical protein